MDASTRKAKRAEAQKLAVSLQVGKNGITEATTQELDAQLRRNKLVKVRLLPSARGDASNKEQADRLATATSSEVVEVRGHTAVLWRA